MSESSAGGGDSATAIESSDSARESVDTSPTPPETVEEVELDDATLPNNAELAHDDGELEDSSLPDHADHVHDDGGLRDDSAPHEWPDGTEVRVSAGLEPSASASGDARVAADAGGEGEVDNAEKIQQARDAVSEAYADGPERNTAEQFDADAAAWAEEHESDPTVKEVEFQEPAPAKEVGYRNPGDSVGADVPNAGRQADEVVGPERAAESRAAEEQQVVDGAKAEIAARREAGEIVGGDPAARSDLWHPQGQNDMHYQQDCALASTSEVLRDCGVDASESDVVRQAAAEGLCDTSHLDPADNGGVNGGDQISELLNRNGVDSHVVNPDTPEDLAAYVEGGHGVITEVNCGELWDGRDGVPSSAYGYNQDGQARVNHAVQVTGTVRDAEGELTGFVVNDTGVPDGAGTVVPVETWGRCWTNTDNDHETVVTRLPTSVERSNR